MAKNFFGATTLTGGGSGVLDAINGNILSEADAAFVVTASGTYQYYLSAAAVSAESSPSIISPDANAGTKRWLRVEDTGISDAVSKATVAVSDASIASVCGDTFNISFDDGLTAQPLHQ